MYHPNALRFHKFSPGGNTTILVTDLVPVRLRAAVAAELMGEHHVHAEQVGFVSLAGVRPRIDMMGGEFCGNACRSLAALLALKRVLVAGPGGLMSGEIESSGVEGPLPVRVVLTAQGPDAAVRMPLPLPPVAGNASGGKDASEGKGAPDEMETGAGNAAPTGNAPPCAQDLSRMVTYPGEGLALVRLPGIAHLLLDAALHPFPEAWRDRARALIDLHGLSDEPAAGCIWHHGPLAAPGITPVVRVRDTDSIILESACGSGSLAYGLLRAASADGETSLAVRQPSGAAIRVSVTRRDGLTPEAWIGGAVRHVASGTAYLYGDGAA
ncbi:diaminopimelate epimerase [Nitratidesulfovibrio sp. HK-II]|uniref:diaminopimelate epimerase n=1 Tax=Nitratidesulfovibrio sp. HK-II TaxID=2009266 RepID=UPI000EE2CE12|nr:diaminopimelate epimerase [Nitratidesulfovibrio sp. HK-II]GBO95183.1 diaminopimelate epimerase [Nitratidesulfovibrio sp. HK-II]